jgi:hypothetical protein
MPMRLAPLVVIAQLVLLCAAPIASAQDTTAGPPPSLDIAWPSEGAVIPLGNDPERAVGVVVRSNFKLRSAGQCGADPRCGHIHLKVDPDGDSCNLPGRPYNSMNSDFGGDLIKARFGPCPSPAGMHVIGVLLADDRHQPVLVNGKPVTRLVTVTTR